MRYLMLFNVIFFACYYFVGSFYCRYFYDNHKHAVSESKPMSDKSLLMVSAPEAMSGGSCLHKGIDGRLLFQWLLSP